MTALPADAQAAFAKQVVSIIEKAGAGYDLGHYRDAPPGLRIWCGATVQSRDLKALTPWIAYAFAEAKAALGKKAALRRQALSFRGAGASSANPELHDRASPFHCLFPEPKALHPVVGSGPGFAAPE